MNTFIHIDVFNTIFISFTVCLLNKLLHLYFYYRPSIGICLNTKDTLEYCMYIRKLYLVMDKYNKIIILFILTINPIIIVVNQLLNLYPNTLYYSVLTLFNTTCISYLFIDYYYSRKLTLNFKKRLKEEL